MFIINKYKFQDKLLKSIKKTNDPLDKDLNDFYELLNTLSEKDLLQILKMPKIKLELQLTFVNNYEILTEENKLIAEKIDKIMFVNGLKELAYCYSFNKDVWKNELLKNPKLLLDFKGELDDEMREKLIEVINQDPNLIYEYLGNDEEVIFEAFKKDNNIQIIIKDNKMRSSNYKFLKNSNFYIKYIEQYQNDFDNPEHAQVLRQLKYQWFNNLNTDVLNYVSDETFKKIIPFEEYKQYVRYLDLNKIKNATLTKMYQVYGPIENYIRYGDEEFQINCYAELYKISSELLLKNQNRNFLIGGIAEGKEIGKLLKEKHGFNDTELRDTLTFLTKIDYKYTKEDIINYPKLYDKIDQKILFTLEDFQKNSNLGISQRLTREVIEYLPVNYLDYIYYPISEETIQIAVEKKYNFTSGDYRKFGYSDMVLKHLFDKKDFKNLYEITNIKSDMYEYAFNNGFCPTIDELRINQHFTINDNLIIHMLKHNLLNAIFYYRGTNIEIYKIALESDLQDKKIDYTESEREYLKFIVKNYNYDLIKYCQNLNNIEYYFDKDGAKKELYQKIFNDKKWEFFEKFTEIELKNNLTEKQFIACKNYKNIKTITLKNVFLDFILKNIELIPVEKIELTADVLYQISISNSQEILHFQESLAFELINLDKPLERLKEVEQIFIKNNLPTVGKLFSVFKVLHPNFEGFNFEGNISPVLKASNNKKREIVVFSDLIKCAFGSNNKSVKEYLDNMEKATNIYNKIQNTQDISTITADELRELTIFKNHLVTLYKNTYINEKDGIDFISSNNLFEDINKLLYLLSPNKTLDYDIKDRLIKMFCHFAGFDTFELAKQYFNQKTLLADKRGRKYAEQEITLEEGDFVKGIGDIKYLSAILQNGSVAKEYLGSFSTSDATPLDTDLSRIMKKDSTIEETLKLTKAYGYGPIYFVLKDYGNRFVETRRSPLLEEKAIDLKKDGSKLEIFYTGVVDKAHYGIRTGFASSEIDYIMCKEYDKRIGVELVMNGFYIPVVNVEGKVLFTPQDYDLLKEKMTGLTYYNQNDYIFANDLYSEGIYEYLEKLDANYEEVKIKRELINKHIEKVINNLGLNLKTFIDGDLTEGIVELIDTGSTGRGTNKPGDGDFDFMMRLDNSIINDPNKLALLNQALEQSFVNVEKREKTDKGDFRFKKVMIDGLDVPVDIDITFAQKTNKVNYSTDMCLQDRLSLIRTKYPDKYNLVIANILLAKSVLKEAGVYKPNRGETPQGGLGGVGVENWILQNGGSFKHACIDFLSHAKDKSFEEFKDTYQIWDFGENHVAAERGQYLHDNFISRNMSEEGYKKMVNALKEYLYNKKNINEENYINKATKK